MQMKNILGYDNNGRVFDTGDFIQRIINPEYFYFAEEVYQIYKNKDLKKIGIVETELELGSKSLRHEKHIISYPYEWSADMYKDSILFHLSLFIELDKHGLVLKDALPSNILFDYNKPVFVDFLSLIKKENLNNEAWLVEGTSFKEKRFAIVEKMLVPYMLVPLLAMGNKNYQQARTMLSQRACNTTGNIPLLNEIIKVSENRNIIKSLKKIVKNIFVHDNNKKIVARVNSYKKTPPFMNYIKDIYELVENIDVVPPASGYASYYSEKKEAFDFSKRDEWGNKQRNVCSILEKEKPSTVIDVGANTGWFSFLAENLGSKVISMDIDEDCVNSIYRVAKKDGRKILPLLISFEDLTRSYFGIAVETSEYADRDHKKTPLFLAPEDRFQGDMILCLGLVHHLVLGSGYKMSDIFKVFFQMTVKSIVLEFVDINDPLIKSEPSFFKNLDKFNESTYNLDLIVENGRKYFKTVEIFDSHPETRKLLLFKK